MRIAEKNKKKVSLFFFSDTHDSLIKNLDYISDKENGIFSNQSYYAFDRDRKICEKYQR